MVEGITVNGIDMIHWNDAGRIDHFKVMVRPLKAVNKLHEMMGRELQQRGGAALARRTEASGLRQRPRAAPNGHASRRAVPSSAARC